MLHVFNAADSIFTLHADTAIPPITRTLLDAAYIAVSVDGKVVGGNLLDAEDASSFISQYDNFDIDQLKSLKASIEVQTKTVEGIVPESSKGKKDVGHDTIAGWQFKRVHVSMLQLFNSISANDPNKV